jgi:hypothetical protein
VDDNLSVEHSFPHTSTRILHHVCLTLCNINKPNVVCICLYHVDHPSSSLWLQNHFMWASATRLENKLRRVWEITVRISKTVRPFYLSPGFQQTAGPFFQFFVLYFTFFHNKRNRRRLNHCLQWLRCPRTRQSPRRLSLPASRPGNQKLLGWVSPRSKKVKIGWECWRNLRKCFLIGNPITNE